MLPVMGDTTPPAPPARSVSTFPAKVTFKGVSCQTFWYPGAKNIVALPELSL